MLLIIIPPYSAQIQVKIIVTRLAAKHHGKMIPKAKNVPVTMTRNQHTIGSLYQCIEGTSFCFVRYILSQIAIVVNSFYKKIFCFKGMEYINNELKWQYQSILSVLGKNFIKFTIDNLCKKYQNGSYCGKSDCTLVRGPPKTYIV